MRLRVLLAEDNADHAFFTVRAFREANGPEVEISTVGDGEQLLDFLHHRGKHADAPRPHLIVLDLRMPKKGGLEALAEIRGSAGLARIPIVILSSSDRHEDISASYASGANSYMTKPSSLSGLRLGVRQLADYWVNVATLPEPA